MTATLVEIADALVAFIGATSLCQPVTAVRKYQANYEINDLESIVITVISRSTASSSASRTTCQYDHTIDLAVQQKIAGDDEQLDALVGLVDEIEKTLRLKTLTTAGGKQAKWVSATSEAAYDLKHLDEKRVFTSVLSLVYRVIE